MYDIAKERHGYEDDWGLVVQRINSEVEEEIKADKLFGSSEDRQKQVYKARAKTLYKKYGSRDYVVTTRSSYGV